ncbi:MAG TPA: FixH family protein [Candidatus Acidoferrum sp.]|nr:FixH family protein [Candidatus Acidoferrum sp.]
MVLMVTTVVALGSAAGAADLKAIKTQKAKDMTVSVLNETGKWKPGKNDVIVEFTKDKKPVDVGKVTLSTSMPMPGMAPMIAGAMLEPKGPGRYEGTITFPDVGERQVTVAWDGPAGKGSTKFAVPVR